MSASDTPIARQKAELRALAAARRRDLHARHEAEGHPGEAALRRYREVFPALPAGFPVAAYWPLADEFDPRVLIEALHGDGARIALPLVRGRGVPLRFRTWTPESEMRRGVFGVMEPPESAPEVVPALLFVPLLAWDASGYRLGYGGGYYDRTLAALRAGGGRVTAIGLAYEGQQVRQVPREETDMPLDWLISEQRVHRFAPTGAAGETG